MSDENKYEQVLRDLLKQKDTDLIHIPYTDAFDQIHETFERQTSYKIDKHALWEMIVLLDLNVDKDNELIPSSPSAPDRHENQSHPPNQPIEIKASKDAIPSSLFADFDDTDQDSSSLPPTWRTPLPEDDENRRQQLIAAISRSEFGTTERQVARILQQHPETRDSSIALCIRYWHRFNATVLEEFGIDDLEFFHLIRKWTTIIRVGWEIQNKLHLCRGMEETKQYKLRYQKDLQQYVESHRNVVPEIHFYLDETGNEGDKAYIGIAGVCVMNWQQYEKHAAALTQWRDQQGPEPIHFVKMGSAQIPRAMSFLRQCHDRRGGLLYVGYSLRARGSTREAIFTLIAQLVKDSMIYLREQGSLDSPRILRVFKEADPAFDNLYLERLTKYLTDLVDLECPDLLIVEPVEAIPKGRNVLLECADLVAGGMQRRALQKGSNPKDVLAEAIFNLTGFEDSTDKGAIFRMYPNI